MDFKRQVIFTPAYDLRHADDGRDYGIHGVDCYFQLIGERGAASLSIFTNWHLPEVAKELDGRPIEPRRPHLSCRPSPAGIAYHRFTPAYEGQTFSREDCELLGGRRCYSDESFSMARTVFEMLVREGDAAVWRELERWYRERVLPETEPSDAD